MGKTHFTLTVIFSILFLSGCTIDIEDPKSFPLQLEVVRSIGDHCKYLESLAPYGFEVDKVLELHVFEERREAYFNISNVAGDFVYSQTPIPLEDFGDNFNEESVNCINLSKLDSSNKTVAFFSILYKDSLSLFLLDIADTKIEFLYSYHRPANWPNPRYLDVKFTKIKSFISPDSSHCYYFNIFTGRMNSPRELVIVDSILPFRKRTHLKTGSLLSKDLVIDKQAGELLFYSGASCTCNDIFFNRLHDCNAYFLSFNNEGKFFWINNLEASGGSTTVHRITNNDSVILGIWKKGAFSNEKTHSIVCKLNTLDGIIVNKKTIEGEVKLIRNDMYNGTQRLISQKQVEGGSYIYFADLDFKRLSKEIFVRDCGPYYASLNDSRISSDPVFIFHNSKGGMLILDKNLRIICSAPFRFLDRQIFYNQSEVYGYNKIGYLPAKNESNELLIAVPKVDKLYFWLLWRYRWLLFIILLISLSLYIMFLIYKQLKYNKQIKYFGRKYFEHVEKTKIDHACDIHDTSGNDFRIVESNLSEAIDRLEKNDIEILDYLYKARDHFDEVRIGIREKTYGLSPLNIKRLGLKIPSQDYAKMFCEREKIAHELNIDDIRNDLDENLAITLYRIFQELLTNVAKHSNASRVKISILQDNEEIILQVEDNGKGFNVNRIKSTSTGIFGMQERLSYHEGSISYKSKPGKGTLVTVICPIKLQDRK